MDDLSTQQVKKARQKLSHAASAYAGALLGDAVIPAHRIAEKAGELLTIAQKSPLEYALRMAAEMNDSPLVACQTEAKKFWEAAAAYHEAAAAYREANPAQAREEQRPREGFGRGSN